MASKNDINSRQLVDIVVSALEDKKGLEIIFIDFSNIGNTVAQYFVICHGTSNVHVATLANGVIEKVHKELGEKPWNKEGMENAEWILLDYADVVVHLFQENTRHFYNLESLWADMKMTHVKSTT
ncbi:MAG TPA: ribosome silencing factor [Bacteroidales bacterium]|nr:ribosome silencing factor [Bacteroidales bacterium]